MDQELLTEDGVIVLPVERRSQRAEDLTCEEIMKLLRERGKARAARTTVIDVD